MKKFIILFPVYNDWDSLWKLCEEINAEVKNLDADFSFLFINDASTEKKINFPKNLNKINSIKVINMKKNHLSGRCIAIGLQHIIKKENFDYVIVMDSDGEDKPEYILDIFKKISNFPNNTILATRFRRNENIIYKFLYEFHKIITLVFTGNLIKFGNFVCLPKNHVNKLISEGSLWNSFSGTITKILKDKISIKTDRGKRYYGPSKTSYFKLIHHSFTIMSVFYKTIFLRSFIISIIYFFFIYESITLIKLIPLFLLFVFMSIILIVSRRESLTELNSSLERIESIEILK